MASQELINIIIKAVDEASATAEKVDNSLRKIGDSSSRLSRIPGFDAMKTKLSSVATALDTKLGGALTKARAKFNSLKTVVTGAATSIRTKMGSAIDGVRAKLTTLSNGAKGLSSAMGFLKGAVSMTAGMIGFELVSGIIEAGRAAINASSQVEYFGQRLQNASGKTKMSADQFKQLKGQVADLQKEFRKVDMTAVAATSEEIALKMNLPANKIGDLTRMTAVLSSTFVKEGRTQEDAVLAVGDALDGQFKRLQEIGITQDKLKENGWNGNLEDQDGLIDALNKTMQEMGYEQTAKDITNLDEAFTALSIAGGQLMQAVLVPLTPILIQIIGAVIQATDAVKPFIQTLQGAVNALPDWLKDAGWAIALGAAVYLLGTYIMATLVPALAAAALAAIDFAIAMMANPFTWVLIALVAIGYAIYEVGKAFGWWTDVSSMLDVVWSAIQRLWDAFINHPDVQGFIQMLVDGWNSLLPVFIAVGQFLATNIVANLQTMIWIIDMVVQHIHLIILTFQEFMNGQITLSQMLSQLWGIIQSMFSTVLNLIINRVKSFGNSLKDLAVKSGSQFVNGIINWLKSLPGKAYSALLLVVSKIASAGAKWVSTAKTKASSVVTNVYNTLSGLPDKIASALSGVASAIAQPFVDAYNKVAEKVEQIKSKAEEIPVIGGLFAGGPSAAGGYEVTESNNELNITIVHDLKNVPNGLNEDAIAELINNSTSNDSFVRAIAESSAFQKYDLRAKNVIAGKNYRARGA